MFLKSTDNFSIWWVLYTLIVQCDCVKYRLCIVLITLCGMLCFHVVLRKWVFLIRLLWWILPTVKIKKKNKKIRNTAFKMNFLCVSIYSSAVLISYFFFFFFKTSSLYSWAILCSYMNNSTEFSLIFQVIFGLVLIIYFNMNKIIAKNSL